jgi:hypothetical protein
MVAPATSTLRVAFSRSRDSLSFLTPSRSTVFRIFAHGAPIAASRFPLVCGAKVAALIPARSDGSAGGLVRS